MPQQLSDNFDATLNEDKKEENSESGANMQQEGGDLKASAEKPAQGAEQSDAAQVASSDTTGSTEAVEDR